MISKNFTLLRIAAFVINTVLTAVIILALLMFTDISEVYAVLIGTSFCAFSGSFNLFEPKAVDIAVQKAKKYHDAAHKIMNEDLK